MSSSADKEYLANKQYQHKCLHAALKVAIINDDSNDQQFVDVDRCVTNLYEGDSHSDILLKHYLDNIDELESVCSCVEYYKYLQHENMYRVKAPRLSMKEGLMARISLRPADDR